MHVMNRAFRPVAIAVLLCTATSVAVAADRPWVEAKSDHFTVASDASEKTARTIAWEFEQVRAAVLIVCPWAKANLDKPVLVLAPRDEAGMKTLAPAFWAERGVIRPASIYAAGPDRHYVALRADVLAENTVGVNPYLPAYRSYASIAVSTGLKRDLPQWFRTGLDDVLGNTDVRDSEIDVGRIIPGHLRTLRGGGQRLHLRELLKVDRSSSWGTFGDAQFPMFTAESWAFVHYLMFADKSVHRPKIDQFVTLVLGGTPIPAASDEVFKNVDALESDFFTYINRDVFEFGHITVDVNVNKEGFATRTWSPAEAKAKQALYLAATRRRVEALALVADARKLDPKLPDTYEVEGIFADVDRKAPEARAAYEKAVELGSTSFYPYLRFANIARAGADAATMVRVEQAFERAVALNAASVPALQQLGDVKVQLGHPDQAIALLQRAVELQPGVFPARMSLARAYWALARKQDAQREAREALALAGNDAEQNRAQQLVNQYSR